MILTTAVAVALAIEFLTPSGKNANFFLRNIRTCSCFFATISSPLARSLVNMPLKLPSFSDIAERTDGVCIAIVPTAVA